MPQIYQRQGLGELLGSGLGQGLGAGLQQLAQNKLQEVTNRQQQGKMSSALQQLLNFTPERANAAAPLPESILRELFKQHLQAPANAKYAEALSGILGGDQGGGMGIEQEGSIQNPNAIPSGLSQQQAFQLAQLKLQAQERDRKNKQAEEDREMKVQDKLEPFLKAQAEDYSSAKKIYAAAKRMRKLLDENKSKFPGWVTGQLPEWAHRDPAVREYIALSNKLPLLLASSRKGQPSNYKVRLEQMSKAHVGQPIETQREILDELERESKSVFDTQKSIAEAREKNDGKLPRDLRQKLIEGGLSSESEDQSEELSTYAGSDIVEDDKGQIYKWDSSQSMYRPAKRKE